MELTFDISPICELSEVDIKDSFFTNKSWGMKRKNEYVTSRKQISSLSDSRVWNRVQLENYHKLKGRREFYSIAHTKKYSIVVKSNSPVGCDIESNLRKLPQNSQKHFINDEDDFVSAADTLTQWCIKEACYKASILESPKLLKDIVIKKNKFLYRNQELGIFEVYNYNEHIYCIAQVTNGI
jgi:hypothetical protein